MTRVESEVSGMVWKIEKAVGDSVELDETIMILESMKMEIHVAAPASGRVTEILVELDQPVQEGQHICTIE
ncbi:MAG: acetyl-CoA carboxylase biotin carboxyl carrier protein subunit [Pseudomonadota bacterium]